MSARGLGRSLGRSLDCLVLTVFLTGACGGGSAGGGSGGAGGRSAGGGSPGGGQAGANGGAAGSSLGGAGGGVVATGVTFWGDVAPIYNTKCVPCHQDGGIGPFPLDNYADAAANAPAERALTQAGKMPPYFMVHDGTCGSFQDERTLTAAEKDTIASWVTGGSVEGTPVSFTRPPTPVLAGAVDVSTPMFAPVAQGGDLAEHDEYRCFALDPPNATAAFLTGYDVSPGEPSIIHHVLVFLVDPQAPSATTGQTNGAVMQALDDESPDRLGWSCFGGAGDGLDSASVPVTWAPGQGIVTYPEGMGVPVAPGMKLVVQVHYNLADPASTGKMDRTTIHMRFADSVTRQLAFLLSDPFLDSLGKATPDTLPAGQADAKYTWSRTARQLGLGGVPSVDLVAVMPHMHGRGLRQTMTLDDACASHLEGWDFHWQEFYFYKTPPKIVPDTKLSLTCEYDTSADTAPVLPGWGTHNEMCLNVLMLALPPATP